MHCKFVLWMLCLTLTASPATAGDGDSKPTAKVRALMVTGGCCHDYQNQKKIISDGLSKSVGNIEWTIVAYGDKREIKAEVYKQSEWIKDFDVVIHNECFGAVKDGDFVQGIVNAHVKHKVPAIVIHCSMHSYRTAPTADSWRAMLGVTSRKHEKSKRKLTVVPTVAGKEHPITASIGDSWETPNGELYIIEKVWPTANVLAQVHSDQTGKDEPVIWTNEYEGVRTFGMSLGHHNETMNDPTWQNILAAGWNWSLSN
jgi:type 1 glutamine amidotransferase